MRNLNHTIHFGLEEWITTPPTPTPVNQASVKGLLKKISLSKNKGLPLQIYFVICMALLQLHLRAYFI